jgi:hypothetical protein
MVRLMNMLLFDKVAEKLCENGDVEKVNDMLTLLLDKGFYRVMLLILI